MTDSTGPSGSAKGGASAEQISILLSAAEQVQASAKEAHLEFVAYFAEMTVLEIRQEIARRAEHAE